MWRLPGIYRSVYLNAKSKVQVKDVIVRTASLDWPSSAKVKVEAYLDNLTKKDVKDLSIIYKVLQCKLWDDETVGEPLVVKTSKLNIKPGETVYSALDIEMPDATYPEPQGNYHRYCDRPQQLMYSLPLD